MGKYFITGDAGFIGFHLSRALLQEGHDVLGLDALTDYYDPQLKRDRLEQLQTHDRFTHLTARLEDLPEASETIRGFGPDVIVHLAAQAGVRYSLEHPDVYLSANVEGTLRVLELARELRPAHLLVASTSSVYGGNEKLPFSEQDLTQSPMSLYAATKIATEALTHSFSHLWDIPTTAFRFFTVYGPWGRPDMALFKFVRAVLAGESIDVYGNGEMRRDFTYVDDLVRAISALAGVPPVRGARVAPEDSVSPVAPYRVVNIAGGNPVGLLDFIKAVENATGQLANKNFLPMQPGDVVATSADPSLLRSLIGDVPQTSVSTGVTKFVDWYRGYYDLR